MVCSTEQKNSRYLTFSLLKPLVKNKELITNRLRLFVTINLLPPQPWSKPSHARAYAQDLNQFCPIVKILANIDRQIWFAQPRSFSERTGDSAALSSAAGMLVDCK